MGLLPVTPPGRDDPVEGTLPSFPIPTVWVLGDSERETVSQNRTAAWDMPALHGRGWQSQGTKEEVQRAPACAQKVPHSQCDQDDVENQVPTHCGT